MINCQEQYTGRRLTVKPIYADGKKKLWMERCIFFLNDCLQLKPVNHPKKYLHNGIWQDYIASSLSNSTHCHSNTIHVISKRGTDDQFGLMLCVIGSLVTVKYCFYFSFPFI